MCSQGQQAQRKENITEERWAEDRAGKTCPDAETVPESEVASAKTGATEVEDKELLEQLEQEKAKAEEYSQRLLRLQADFDNFRRRTRQEKEDGRRQAQESLFVALLPVLDNFERALAEPGERLEDFVAGVEMIYRQLENALIQQGLEPLGCSEGKEFDPTVHEAFAQVETNEVAENTVVEECRPGYSFDGKVLRPAMVKVAKEVAEEEKSAEVIEEGNENE